MEIKEIQSQLDAIYEQQDLDQLLYFLMENLTEAMQENDDSIVLFLLNELLGYYRVTAKFNEGERISEQLYRIIDSRGLNETLTAATSYLNIATLYRASGNYQKALSYYKKTEEIYQKLLDIHDERYGAFYNNVSLLYLEYHHYDKAIDYGLKALTIMESLDGCEVEVATTYVNLAQMYYASHRIEEGMKCLNRGIEIFEEYAPLDPHYFAAIATKGTFAYQQKDYLSSIKYYQEALDKIESVFGKNKDYMTVYQNLQEVQSIYEHEHMNGLSLSKDYYLTYGQAMIDENFSDIKSYMAIGLCGFGSECMGYDDVISRDHDFGPGFCIWLPRDIYRQRGKELQQAYLQLPQVFRGIRRVESLHGQNRVGVFVIEDFFESFLQRIPSSLQDWLYADENALLAVTNGALFDDYYGRMSELRKQLHYYPEDIRLKKMARAVAKMAQSGQYNYARCMKRHQEGAAYLALNEFVEQTLSLIYLMNKKYKPYYKWTFYGLKDCPLLNEVGTLLKELIALPPQTQAWQQETPMINTNDQKVVIIEKICQIVIHELQLEGLTSSDDDFLDNHALQIMQHIKDDTIRHKHIMEG